MDVWRQMEKQLRDSAPARWATHTNSFQLKSISVSFRCGAGDKITICSGIYSNFPDAMDGNYLAN